MSIQTFSRAAAGIALLGLALGSARPAHASLGFCRTDPTVVFKTADGTSHEVLLTASISLPRKSVSSVVWSVSLPASAQLLRVTQGGPVNEQVTVNENGFNGVVSATADVVASDTAEVDLAGSTDRHVSTASTTGTTNQLLTLQVGL